MATSHKPHGVEPKILFKIAEAYFRFMLVVSKISRLGGIVLLNPASESACVNRITVRGR